jgi:hypothetical protein
VSSRIDKSWLVFASIESLEGDLCVDLFARPDGSLGFDAFRRDPEDGGIWTPLAYYSAASYESGVAALAAAETAVPWLAARLRQEPALRDRALLAAPG